MRCICDVDWRHGHPVVRHGKVELDAKRSPSPSVANPRLLDGWVSVEHRLAVDFVGAGIDVASDIRQYGAFQIFVFEKDRPQLVNYSPVGDFVSQRVGIVESPASTELIKWGMGVGAPRLIDGKFKTASPHAHLCTNGDRKSQKTKRYKFPSHPVHLEKDSYEDATNRAKTASGERMRGMLSTTCLMTRRS